MVHILKFFKNRTEKRSTKERKKDEPKEREEKRAFY